MKSIEWLAGLIDAEGSFYLTYTSRGARVVGFSLSMTDLQPVKHASEILQLPISIQKPTGNAKQKSFRIRARTTNQVLPVIEAVLPYLVTKRNSADLILMISDIIKKHVDDPSYKYSTDDKLKLVDLEERLTLCNKVCPEYAANPKFSIHWLAGMTDGDGSVYASECRIKDRRFHRLEYKISLKDRHTIEYLNHVFQRNNSNNPFQDKRPNRNKKYSFRLVSGHAAAVLIQLRNQTVIKNRQIELGLELNRIRSTRSVLENADRVEQIVSEMKRLNKN